MARAAQLWIMVDIETSGPVIGTHSMTELGAAVGSVEKGLIGRFEALIRPVGTAAVASRDSFEKAMAEGLPPKDAMSRFAAWSAPYLMKSAFDWP